MREIVTLACEACKSRGIDHRNYNTTRNKRRTPDRFEFKKYCRFCRKHTVHKETR